MKIPPISKIYEAFSAIADNRITITKEEAIIKSSDYKKTYTVKWKENLYASTDNATYWQGYPGYPVIAVWLLTGILPYNSDNIKYFKNINWHELNEKNKRDYDKSINDVLNELASQNIDTEKIEEDVDNIYSEIKKLPFQIARKIK